jgi:hypothetical protein
MVWHKIVSECDECKIRLKVLAIYANTDSHLFVEMVCCECRQRYQVEYSPEHLKSICCKVEKKENPDEKKKDDAFLHDLRIKWEE